MILYGSNLAGREPNPEGMAYWAMMLDAAVARPDFRTMPRLPALTEADVRTITAFTRVLAELFRHQTFQRNSGVTIHIDDDGAGERVEAVAMPEPDEIRGTLVAFRQVYNSGDKNSFAKVRTLMQRAVGRLPDVGERKRATAILRRAGEADRLLRREYLNDLASTVAHRMFLEDHGITNAPPYEQIHRDLTPEDTIRMFMYGIGIHWGDDSDRFERLLGEHFDHAMASMNLLNAMRGTMELYLWFAGACQIALGRGVRFTPPPVAAAPAR